MSVEAIASPQADPNSAKGRPARRRARSDWHFGRASRSAFAASRAQLVSEPTERAIRAREKAWTQHSRMLIFYIWAACTTPFIVIMLSPHMPRTQVGIAFAAFIGTNLLGATIRAAARRNTESRAIARWVTTADVLINVAGGLVTWLSINHDDAGLTVLRIMFFGALWAQALCCVIMPILRSSLWQMALRSVLLLAGWALTDRPHFGAMLTGAIVFIAAGAAIHRPVWRRLDELAALERHVRHANDELEHANELLEEMANHDSLTGLTNRAKLIPSLTELLEANDGEGVALLFLDVDHFKGVNDSLGHAAGDHLLQAIAHRAETVFDGSAILSRLGGDEFTFVLCPSNHSDAQKAAERLRETVAEPVELEGRSVIVTASIGVAMSRPGTSAEDLLRHADAALYSAKAAGRNRTELFDEALASTLERRLDEEQGLRAALESNRIEPWFQPEVDLGTGAVVGVEALARFDHPERGILEAGDFFGMADESGVLERLSELVVGKAIEERGAWHNGAVVPFEFPVRVHASPHQILSPTFVSTLKAQLEQSGCPAGSVIIEVTENELITDIARAREQLEALQEMGCRTVLDDFGRGYSCFSLLTQLPFNGVKIDQTLCRRAVGDDKALAIVEALLHLAKALGLSVCADGVETREQAELLRRLGCQTAQGYLWSPALKPSDVLALLDSDDECRLGVTHDGEDLPVAPLQAS